MYKAGSVCKRGSLSPYKRGKFKSLESYQFVVVRVGLLSVAETLEVTGTPGCPGLDTSLAVWR